MSRDVDKLEGKAARLKGQGFIDQEMGTRKTIQPLCKAFCAQHKTTPFKGNKYLLSTEWAA